MSPSCLDCAQRSDRVFCDLGQDALREFDGIKSLQAYPRGAKLLQEGQSARSIFLVCRGRVRLSVCSENGRQLSLRVAEPGEILGLSAALSGGFHEVSAEAVEPVQVAEVRRKDLIRFLRAHRDVCLQVVHLLSEDLHVAYERVRAVGLGRPRHPHSATAV